MLARHRRLNRAEKEHPERNGRWDSASRARRRTMRTSLTVLIVLGMLGSSLFMTPLPGPARPSARSGSQIVALAPLAQPSPAELVAAARSSAQQGHGPGGLPLPTVPRAGSTTPNVTYSLAMTYDVVDHYVVAVTPNVTSAYGGYGVKYGNASLTWVYSNGSWSIVSTTGAPPSLLYPGITFDDHDGYVLLFGGMQIFETNGSMTLFDYTNQTWSYRGGHWTNRSAAWSGLPPPDEPVAMTYDGGDGYVLLLDWAAFPPQSMFPTAWAYQAGNWTNVTGPTTGRVPLLGVMTYDAADRYVVYYGTLTSGPGLENWTTLSTLWTYRAGIWSNFTANTTNAPPGRIFPGITYDSATGQVVIFGGTEWAGPLAYTHPNDTWAYSAGAWTNLNRTTPGTQWVDVNLVYDPNSSAIVLLGQGNNSTNPAIVSRSWLLNSSGWAPGAPAFRLHAVGADAGTPFQLDVHLAPYFAPATFLYSGLPPGCVGVNAPTLTCTTNSPGRYSVHVVVTDSAGDSLGLATTVQVHPPPLVLSFGASVPVAEVGVALTLSTVASGGTGALTYAYSGLPMGCTSVNGSTVACTPEASGSISASVRITDAIAISDSASITFPVAARPSVTTFEVLPTVVDVGQNVTLVALAAGGVGPVNFTYSGLPVGCSNLDQLSLRCVPGSAGSYPLEVQVTDVYGATASGTGRLTVHNLPAISGFTSSTTTPVVGSPFSLSVSMSSWGGTAPFAFVYSGLPPGCPPQDSATFTCTPVTTGNYTVVVRAIDSTGASVTAPIGLAVSSAVIPRTPSSPTGLLSAGQGGAAFAWGLAIGAVGLALVGAWAARALRLGRQGEAIVAELEIRARAPPRTVPDAGNHPDASPPDRVSR